MKDIIMIIITILTIVAACAIIVLGIVWVVQTDFGEKFNDGYCSKCNSELEYVNTIYMRHNRFKHIYICSNCGHVIESSISPECLPKYKTD